MLDARLPHLPDEWERVWAFSDPHGMSTALRSALSEAGIVDAGGHWCAAPGTALVGCGDYIDRGPDSLGILRLLRRLEQEASAAGGAACFALGNHEQMAIRTTEAHPGWLETWQRYGGDACFDSFGIDAGSRADPLLLAGAIDDAVPGLLAWLGDLPQAVRWRNVLFVHGGLPSDHGLEDLGVITDQHLWVRRDFFELPWAASDFERYRRAGIERVVFGHTTQPDGPTLYQDGHSLGIDTGAARPAPDGGARRLTLIGIDHDDLAASQVISVPTADGTERA